MSNWALFTFFVSLVRLVVVVKVAAELVGIGYLLINVVLFVLNWRDDVVPPTSALRKEA